MFFWTIEVIFEPLVYVGIFYFVRLFVTKEDFGFGRTLAVFLLLLPTVILASTKLGVLGFDISNCDRTAIEGPLAYYGYLIELFFIAWILITSMKSFLRNKDKSERRKTVLITIGSVGFLAAFSFGNVIGSLFSDSTILGDYSWSIGQYGIFGVPIFTAFLAYLIVKYQSLNIKIIGTQVLVFGLIIIIGSELFFVTNLMNQVLVVVTLLLSIAISYFLVQSVKKEIEAKEALAVANKRLEELDIQKTEFVSFATHQLRSPLASMKGYASLVIDGDLGPVNDKVRDAAKTILKSAGTLANVVEDYLNISRIELGTMKYDMKVFDAKDFLKEIVNEQKPNIDEKGLAFSVAIDESQMYRVNADRDKFKQVVMNIIDNSVKYTPTGSLSMSLEKKDGKVRIKIADTGVGIDPKVMPLLFKKFSRAKDASETNIHGTGLGLFLAREISNAHGGNVWAESAGVGKGSQFYIELPEVK
ncbi:MAG: HAMP domain-containing sensor histidine kinase [Candidatus Paceibacterota bacterium]